MINFSIFHHFRIPFIILIIHIIWNFLILILILIFRIGNNLCWPKWKMCFAIKSLTLFIKFCFLCVIWANARNNYYIKYLSTSGWISWLFLQKVLAPVLSCKSNFTFCWRLIFTYLATSASTRNYSINLLLFLVSLFISCVVEIGIPSCPFIFFPIVIEVSWIFLFIGDFSSIIIDPLFEFKKDSWGARSDFVSLNPFWLIE